MKSRWIGTVVLVLWVTLAMPGQSKESSLLLYGGPIYTSSDPASRVDALVLENGRVAFAGPLELAREVQGAAREINLEGAVAYPGFVDAHAHLAGIGFAERQLDLTGSTSLEDLKQKLAAWSKIHPVGPIKGRGWIETHWPSAAMPTKEDLDRVVSDRPVLLARADGHAAVANSAALLAADINDATEDPAGGRVVRDAQGHATGLVIDYAIDLLEKLFATPSDKEYAAALEAAAKLYASRGWTGLGYMDAGWPEIAELAELARRNRLPIRVDAFLRGSDAQHVFDSGMTVDATNLVRVRGVKLYMDGALGSRGAALLEPYSDAPESAGLLLTQPAALSEMLQRARDSDVQVAIHAIGDRGNRLALDGIIGTFADRPDQLKERRWRIEHAQVLAAEDLPRFGRYGVIASMQPSHAISDLYFAPNRLGATRLAGAYAWHDLLASGATIAGGSDAPVEKGDPLMEFYAATYRHDLAGKAGPDWHPEQAMTKAEAIRAFTWAPAYGVRQEEERGTLEVGKHADVSVFSVDLFAASPQEVLNAHAVMTIVAGKVVYSVQSETSGGKDQL
jgi:predicted amidohydrolase YtcJ